MAAVMGPKMAMAMTATMPPTKTIMIGSIREVNITFVRLTRGLLSQETFNTAGRP